LQSECRYCLGVEDCTLGYPAGALVSFRGFNESTWESLRETDFPENKLGITEASWPSAKLHRLSCGALLCCAITEKPVGGFVQNTVLCWGNSLYDRLGTAVLTDFTFFSSSQPVEDLPTATVSVSVSQQVDDTDLSHMSCALLQDGTVHCWGQFMDGENLVTCNRKEFFTGNMSTVSCGFRHATLSAVQVRTASATACARTDTNELWCWGRAINTLVTSSDVAARWDLLLLTPSQQTLTDFVLGDDFLCGLYSDQNVICAWPGKQGPYNLDSYVGSMAASVHHLCIYGAMNGMFKC
jgi:hypothetical protein